jgi:Arc/MetJ-type ribon-helix-helix transcriptional regulator
LSEKLVDQIREQGKKRGFATASAFMRAAIERELSGSAPALDGTEERLAATIDRLAGELRRVRTGQQGLDLQKREMRIPARPNAVSEGKQNNIPG